MTGINLLHKNVASEPKLNAN